MSQSQKLELKSQLKTPPNKDESSPPSAHDYNQWGYYYDHEEFPPDIEKAIHYYRLAVAQGDPDAQDNLGICYEQGRGVDKDAKEAVRLYRLAAEQGHAAAQIHLGYCYEKGLGVDKDEKEAVRRYLANQENHEAQNHLARCIEEGVADTPINLSLAAHYYEEYSELGNTYATCSLARCNLVTNRYRAENLYRSAANAGNVQAQLALGDHLQRRWQDTFSVEAIHFYTAAAKQGSAPGLYALARYCSAEKDLKMAMKYCRAAADLGYAEAQNQLGEWLESQANKDIEKGEQILSEAVKYYTKSAKQGNCAAQCNLGLCYELGKGVAKDSRIAADLYQEAAKQSYPVAYSNLGRCYEKGAGVEQDFKKAVKLYEAATLGLEPQGKKYLADCYLNGVGVEKDEKEAVRRYRLCLEHNPQAVYSLARCVEMGIGVESDAKEARRLYQQASDQGNADAQKYLADYYYKDQNMAEAIKLYSAAAMQGHLEAIEQLMGYYQSSKAIPKDEYALRVLRHIVAKSNDIRAMMLLGDDHKRRSNTEDAFKFYGLAVMHRQWQQSTITAQDVGHHYFKQNMLQQAMGYYNLAITRRKEQGHQITDETKANLAHCYLYGKGVAKNVGRAAILLQSICHGGIPNNNLPVQRQLDLAYCYEKGLGKVELNAEKAVRVYVALYRKAPQAAYRLGRCSEQGIGVTKNLVAAKKCYQDCGEPKAQYRLAMLLAKEKRPSSQPILARFFKKPTKESPVDYDTLAAECGFAKAQNALGLSYQRGKGVPKDEKTAVAWFKRSVAQGDAEGYCHLGNCYLLGSGVQEDKNQALQYFVISAELQCPAGIHQLATCYQNGWGVPQDENLAGKIIQLLKADKLKPDVEDKLAEILAATRPLTTASTLG